MNRNESQQFQIFAKQECENSSPLYEYLSYKIAEDNELLALATTIPLGQPVPNLFFASVHFLLMDAAHELKDYYASFTNSPKPVDQAFAPFKQFTLSNADALVTLFQSKLVQTNEVRRCAYLYPMISEIYEKHKQPLALIEIGASAGLQLAMDQFNYFYNEEQYVENTNYGVLIKSNNLGEPLPTAIYTKPIIQSRIGLDLNPIDVKKAEDLKWLQALIWPEHADRRKLLLNAAEVLTNINVQLIQGDAVAKIEEVCNTVDPDAFIVIYHTHVANQIPKPVRIHLMETLKNISIHRPLYHCYNNLFDAELHQDLIQDGNITSIRLMEKPDGHARTFKWS
ncbi:DUF2332 domain-containing protein [Solibacillus sp. CAU 1738]|uniref:DUF2332 domain-containing protein n=1 Tax=Solibacillus sp. CAU 1738 TaxID=3140363 RepID=UPI0032602674